MKIATADKPCCHKNAVALEIKSTTAGRSISLPIQFGSIFLYKK
ncbi:MULTISPECIES: hypothetical protein [unclassified Pseudomonas]